MATSTLDRKVRAKPISKPSLGAESIVAPTPQTFEFSEVKQSNRSWPMVLWLALVLLVGAAIATVLSTDSVALKTAAIFVAAWIEWELASR